MKYLGTELDINGPLLHLLYYSAPFWKQHVLNFYSKILSPLAYLTLP